MARSQDRCTASAQAGLKTSAVLDLMWDLSGLNMSSDLPGDLPCLHEEVRVNSIVSASVKHHAYEKQRHTLYSKQLQTMTGRLRVWGFKG